MEQNQLNNQPIKEKSKMSTSNAKKEKAINKNGIKERVLNLEKSLVGLSAAYSNLASSHNTLLERLDHEKNYNDDFKQRMKITTQSIAGVVRLIRDQMPLTEKGLSEAVSKNEEDSLVGQTEEMLANGVLEETEEIKENSYLITKEFNKEGETISRRSQFPLSSLTEKLRPEFLGKKIGDSVKLEEGNLVEICQVFDIIEPTPKEDMLSKKTPSEDTEGAQIALEEKIEDETLKEELGPMELKMDGMDIAEEPQSNREEQKTGIA